MIAHALADRLKGLKAGPMVGGVHPHRVPDSYDAIVDACSQAWNALTPERLRSLTLQPWIQKVTS